MERPAMNTAAGRTAYHDGCRRVPEVMAFGDKVRNLIERADDEINELHFGDGTETEIAHTASRTDNSRFADRSIDHALPAESFEQAFASLERAAVDANVFADQ